jgi:hypothetical protein
MNFVVMLIALGVHYGPATLSGFDTIAACKAAQPTVVAFYRKTTRSNQIITQCVELQK